MSVDIVARGLAASTAKNLNTILIEGGNVTPAERIRLNNLPTNTNQELSNINTAVDNKVDIVVGKSLIGDTEIARLATVSNFDNTINILALDNKVDKVIGKELSENNYTTVEKNKLATIEDNAQINTVETISLNGIPQVIISKNVDIVTPSVSGGHQIIDKDGNILPTQPNLRFLGDVEIIDNAGSSTTEITIATSPLTKILN